MSTTTSLTEDAMFQWLNMALGIAYGLANFAMLIILPVLIRHDIWGLGWHWALFAAPVSLLSNGFWALQHEAIHSLFSASPGKNKLAGRLMAISFGTSFRVLRFGHLMHHRFNRHQMDRPDSYDPRVTSLLAARCRFFAEILGGLYLLEVLGPIIYWLPQPRIHRLLDRIYRGDQPPMALLRHLARQALGSQRAIREIRQDIATAHLLYILAFIFWGKFWWILALLMLARGGLISFLDNIYHFRTPLDRPDFAYNLHLARPFRSLILNMNFHRIHHHHMHLPWWQLPRRFADDGDRYDAAYIHAALAQLRGPAPMRLLITP